MIDEFEARLRSGETQPIRETAQRLNLARVPRDFRLPMANLFRRAGLFGDALRLLAPLVRPGTPDGKATPGETVEYCVNLQKLGAVTEALKTLEAVDPEIEIKALLYKVHCLFAHWRYEDSVPILQRYLLAPQLNEYERVVARTNLAAAHLACDRFAEAESLVDRFLSERPEDGWHRMTANNLEIKAQIEIHKERWGTAGECLDRALSILKSHELTDFLFLNKWKAYLKARRTGDASDLLGVREQAARRKHWESVRHVDFLRLDFSHDADLPRKLYFGTPFDHFKRRLKGRFGSLPDRYDWNGPQERVFDVANGRENDRVSLKVGQKVHLLLQCLSGDFYRPASIGAVFAAVFPREYFNAESSPNRIHQLMRRTRQWFGENRIPLRILEEDGSYRLEFTGAYAIRIAERAEVLSAEHAKFEALKKRFARSPFTAKEAAEFLKISPASVNRLLVFGQENGWVARTGSGKYTRYHMTGT